MENASLAAVPPPDINYNLAMPADVIQKGKLSDLQLEAVVYGCMRHLRFLPAAATPDGEEEDMMQDQEGRDGRGRTGARRQQEPTPQRARRKEPKPTALRLLR